MSQRGLKAPLTLVLLAGAGCVHTKSTIPFHEEELRSPYYALMYVYREESTIDADVSWGVWLDENSVGRLRQGAYLTFHVPPGTHTVSVGGNASRSIHLYSAVRLISRMEIKAKGGETYYLRCKGHERRLLTRDQAIGSLRTMKYDQGD